MRRRDFIACLGVAFAWPVRGRAQQADRVRRIGVLHIVPDRASTAFAAFKKKLEQLGYVEGRNIAFEYRWSDQTQRLPALAAELTGLRVDVIVAGDTTTTSAVKQATKDIPIVAAVFVDDPVASGLVISPERTCLLQR
jgi:putative tryptophan/tyrosine transport system substrate-binding protein